MFSEEVIKGQAWHTRLKHHIHSRVRELKPLYDKVIMIHSRTEYTMWWVCKLKPKASDLKWTCFDTCLRQHHQPPNPQRALFSLLHHFLLLSWIIWTSICRWVGACMYLSWIMDLWPFYLKMNMFKGTFLKVMIERNSTAFLLAY